MCGSVRGKKAWTYKLTCHASKHIAHIPHKRYMWGWWELVRLNVGNSAVA